MNLFLPLLLLFSCVLAGVTEEQDSHKGTLPTLHWKQAPKKLERGVVTLSFELKNDAAQPFFIDRWVPQTGNGDFPNVSISAESGKGADVRHFKANVAIGQIPVVRKVIRPGQREIFDAEFRVSLPEGKYTIWAELHGNRSIVTEKIEVEIKGGTILPPLHK